MRYTTTAGQEVIVADYCQYCNINTAGGHELNCPNYNNNGMIVKEIVKWNYLEQWAQESEEGGNQR